MKLKCLKSCSPSKQIKKIRKGFSNFKTFSVLDEENISFQQ
jgi:hypothetical protein